MTPVEDTALKQRLNEILDSNLADDSFAWELRPDGGWVPPSGSSIGAQRLLQVAALQRTRPWIEAEAL